MLHSSLKCHGPDATLKKTCLDLRSQLLAHELIAFLNAAVYDGMVDVYNQTTSQTKATIPYIVIALTTSSTFDPAKWTVHHLIFK